MTIEQIALLEKRKANLDTFYKDLLFELVNFIKHLEIKDAHIVLKQAFLFVDDLDIFFKNIMIVNEDERIWLITRIGYFVGEYFVQKYQGCWIVCEVTNSSYFGRYVIGDFAAFEDNRIFDPFEVAQMYVGTSIPRQLNTLLKEIDSDLLKKNK
nr:hypothetical protein [uncultured Flavobacterium sp.]